MAATLLPADADLALTTLNVFTRERDENGTQHVVRLADLSGSVDAGALAEDDDTYQGDVITGYLAGAALAQWETVYMGGSSTWLLADGNGSGTYPARGLAVAATDSGDAAIILTKGVVRNDAWNWTPGGNLYLSNTAGALTQSATVTSGERLQMVGFALTADKALFNFTPTFATIP
jgi:hypothetical protein